MMALCSSCEREFLRGDAARKASAHQDSVPQIKGRRSMHVVMRNTKTGELREVGTGWSWVLFLFSSVLGLPLFLRRLNVWGFVFLALWAVGIIAPSLPADDDDALGLVLVLFLIGNGMSIWLGIKGNEMTAKNYLENGWEFAKPDDDVTKMAKAKWGITV
jgi:hypothetical protein